jgi:ethanolamine ammonia-lyase small subunit
MAYRPNTNHSDADRNLISNIHSKGLDSQTASTRILGLATQMMAAGVSGFTLREAPPALEVH